MSFLTSLAVPIARELVAYLANQKERKQQVVSHFEQMAQIDRDAKMLAVTALTILVATQVFAVSMFAAGMVYGMGQLMEGAYVISTFGAVASIVLGYFSVQDQVSRVENNEALLREIRGVES